MWEWRWSEDFCKWFKCHLRSPPSLQSFPVQPGSQTQIKSFSPGRHSPWMHGFDSHSLITWTQNNRIHECVESKLCSEKCLGRWGGQRGDRSFPGVLRIKAKDQVIWWRLWIGNLLLRRFCPPDKDHKNPLNFRKASCLAGLLYFSLCAQTCCKNSQSPSRRRDDWRSEEAFISRFLIHAGILWWMREKGAVDVHKSLTFLGYFLKLTLLTVPACPSW